MKISGNPRLSIIQNGSTIESTNVTIIKSEVTTVRSPEGGVSETYQQRKGMLSEYQELFKALWRLPDKEVQQKVLRCINAKYRSVETQTDPVEILEINPKIQKHDAVEDKSIVNTNNQESTSPNDTCSEPSKPATPKKRKRKRKVSVPQVNKESRVAVTHKRQLAKMRQQNQHEKESCRENVHIRNGGEMKRSRLDSDMSDASFLSGVMGDDLDLQLGMRCKEKLFQTIVKDTILADVPLENGLL